jgi:uncharacterized phage-associated protein
MEGQDSNELPVIEVARNLVYLFSRDYDSLKDSDLNHILHLGIQKRLFFAQSISLYYFDKELFSEDFEAWKHGPVVPSLYTIIRYNSLNFLNGIKPYPNDSFVHFILKTILEVTKTDDVWDLVNMTHAESTPWANVYEKNANKIMSKKSMKNDFPSHENIFERIEKYFENQASYKNEDIPEYLQKEFF